MELLLGTLVPTAGVVLWNGEPATAIDDGSRRRLVGFAGQSSSLASGTIGANIDFSRGVDPARSEALVARALPDLTSRTSDALGPRGSGVSGGQAQRIALAHALVHEPQLLVLDEPTSALDGETETAIVEMLRELLAGDTTVLLISHRRSPLTLCDRFLVVDGGTITEVGSVDAALARMPDTEVES